MAYTALTVTNASAYDAVTNPLSSSFIPGNRDYYATDVRDTAFYAELEADCDKLN